eukprot:4595194-Pyramimonas_sp.AAC.1
MPLASEDPYQRQSLSTEKIMHSITCHCMAWVSEKGRWMTPMELMLSQGFPVLDQTVAPCTAEEARSHLNTSSFRRRPERSRTATVKQAGNTMNVHVCACVIAYVLGWTDTVATTSMFAA